jgi:3-isopropylmalate/(R)-2-methylmalate dehydratase small subunit
VRKFTTIEGGAYPWGAKNIDTDIIIPAAYLKTISRKGLGAGAFESIRAQPGNIFDDPRYSGSPILIAGDNFGCGSSREHAAWAIDEIGIRVVIAPSFSDIFSGNAVKNGILPVVLPQDIVDRLLEVASEGLPITVDLKHCVITTPYQDRFAFAIDPFRREMLIDGQDEIGLTLKSGAAVDAFEEQMSGERPWLAPTLAARA